MAPLTFNFAQDVIDRLAAQDRVGLIFIDEHGHRRDYTFSEIAHHSQRYAGALRNLGILAGDRVLICASNTAKCLFTLLGLERLGAVAVPCPVDRPGEEIARIAQKSAARTVVIDRRRRHEAADLRGIPELERFLLIGEESHQWERLDRLAENARALAGDATPSADPACVLEGVTYDHGALYEAMEQSRRLYGAEKGDIVWAALPMGGTAWFANTYLAPWASEAATVLHDAAFSAVERLDLLRELDVSILIQSGHEYFAQTQAPELERFRARRLNKCYAIDGAVDPEAARKWMEIVSLSIEDAAGGVALAASSSN